MKTLRYLMTFIVGVVLTFTLLWYHYPFWFIYICVLVLALLLLVVPQMHIVYKSNNLKRIERYLEENKRKPIFAFPLAVKTGESEKIIDALEAILTKYKQPYIQEVYKTVFAFYEKDKNVSKIEHLAKQIRKEPLRTYYLAYAEVLKSNFEEARNLKEQLPTGWWQHAIEAIIANEQGDMITFQKEAKCSVEHARGVQKFTLFYSFKQMVK